ncbi:MAG: hypothetical protein ABFE07_28760 [Armatimonadia bacterium]
MNAKDRQLIKRAQKALKEERRRLGESRDRLSALSGEIGDLLDANDEALEYLASAIGKLSEFV